MQKQYPKIVIKRSTLESPKNGIRIDSTDIADLRHDQVLTQLVIRSNYYKL